MNTNAIGNSAQNQLTRICQIEEHGARLEKSIECLHERIREAISRLSPVTRQEAPEVKPNTGNSSKEMLVPMADNLRSAHDRVQSATAMLDDLLARLELP